MVAMVSMVVRKVKATVAQAKKMLAAEARVVIEVE